MAKPKRAKAHHVLPRFYLHAWANEQKAVSMLTRDGRTVTTGTRSLAVENDFYTLTTPDGRPDSSVEEGLLRGWDGQGAGIHNDLLAGVFPLQEEMKAKFALFMALQWLRGRAARRVNQEAHDVVTKVLVTMGLDLDPVPDRARAAAPDPRGGSVAVPRLGHLPEEIKTVLRDTDAYTFETTREELVRQMIEHVPHVAAVFLESRWVLGRLDSRTLLTSDEPISMYRTPTHQNEHLGLGFGNAELIQFPLSPDRCLMLDRVHADRADTTMDISEEEVAAMNHLTLNGRWKQLFKHPLAPPFPSPPPMAERFVRLA